MTILRTLPALAVGLMLSGAASPVAAVTQCTAGWAGSIQYSRKQSISDSKTEQRISGKGTETTNWTLNHDYSAQVSVRPAPDGDFSLGRANIAMTSISNETKSASDKMICPHERHVSEMSGKFVRKSETRGTGSDLEADVHVGVDMDGTYRISLSLPDIKGTTSGSDSASYSGQCKAKEGVNKRIPEMPSTIDGMRFSSSGEDRISPADPNRLAGSHSVSAFGATETLKWNLRRCGGALRLVDLKFEDMRFPVWEDWQEITEQVGTIDGNLVRIKAIVANDSPEEKGTTVKFRDTYKGDKWDGARPDGLLGEVAVTIPAGEQREVSFQWDSSGFAWFDDGRPRLTQRIKAEIEDQGKKADDMTRNLKVAPKPLLLVHGLWSNWKVWESWQNILTTTHSYGWKAFPVGEYPQHGLMKTGEEVGNFGPTNTISQNADQLGRYIEYAQRDRNAWHVDIVAHSMGGLISRRYIHEMMPSYADGKPLVSRLVMLGTPNMGSRCADLISAPLEFADIPMEALRELRPSVVETFNAMNSQRRGVEFSVLAGNPMYPVCYMLSANDSVVAVPSAIWTIEDHEIASIFHTDMITTKVFSDFIRPRIARGPGEQGPMKPKSGTAGRLMLLGYEDALSPGSETGDFSKIVKLDPGQTAEIAIPVKAALNFGMTFIATNLISASLLDESGAVIAANEAGKPEASQMFRSLFVDRAIAQGQWTLKLHNGDRFEREVVLSTWSTPQ